MILRYLGRIIPPLDKSMGILTGNAEETMKKKQVLLNGTVMVTDAS